MNYHFSLTRTLVDCGEYWDDPVAPREDFYETTYPERHVTLHAEDSDAKYAAISRILPPLVRGPQVSVLVDLGCGSCHVLARLLDDIPSFIGLGVDVSGAILRQGVTHDRLVKLRAAANNVPLADNTVTLVLCVDLLEHTPEPAAVLSEAARIAGLAIVKVPLERSFYTLLRGGHARLDRMRVKYGHIHAYSRRSLLDLLSSSFLVREEHYDKIPRRGFIINAFQEILLRSHLYRLYAFLFGGFMIALLESRTSLPATGDAV